MLVFFWFPTVSSVKALNSKCSHGQESIHKAFTPRGERLWRVEIPSLHTGKPLEISRKTAKKPQWRWTLWNQSLHTRILWKSGIKILHVKGWMLFLRIKNAYRSLPLSVCWYDLSGRRIESASSQHGIYLRQTQYANGSVVCEIMNARWHTDIPCCLCQNGKPGALQLQTLAGKVMS